MASVYTLGLQSFHSGQMSLRNGFSGQLRCWRGRSTAEPSHYRPSTGQCSHIGLTEYFSHVRLRMSQLAHGRSTFAMISSQLCRRARQGQGIASAFGTPVHWGCNDSVVADYRRIPSGSRGGPICAPTDLNAQPVVLSEKRVFRSLSQNPAGAVD